MSKANIGSIKLIEDQCPTPHIKPQAFGSQILSSNIILPPSDEPHPKRARAKPSSGIMKFLDTRLSLRKVNSSPP